MTMNIHPKAIKEFIDRPRDSHTWLKKCKNSELNRILEDAGFKTKVPIQKHQRVCLILGIVYKTFAYWLDMGLGKTMVALLLIKYWIKKGYIKSALVLVYSESALFSWEDEIKKWNIDLPYVILNNSASQTKWDNLAEFEGGIILATYAGLTRMLCKPVYNEKKKRNKLKISPSSVNLLKKMGVYCLVTDEATELSKKQSLQSTISRKISKFAPYRYELAGRPFGKDPISLWNQLYIIDKGETLGDTLGMFRASFYKQSFNHWGGVDYRFKNELRPRLNRILRHRSIQYRYQECGKLPKLVAKLEEIPTPDEALSYYEQYLENLKKEKAGFRENSNSFLRMRQISSGFVGVKNDETGERAQIEFKYNPKLDRLIELIQQVPEDSKWIIFHDFTYSGKTICDRLKKLKIKHGWLHGGIKNSRELQAGFKNGDLEGLVVNSMLGAYSLNLQRANYLFFYESPVPIIRREQAERRVRRKGQDKTVFQYDLVCRGTSDIKILQWHREGGSLFKALIQD